MGPGGLALSVERPAEFKYVNPADDPRNKT
jgi:hypothetical protein